MSDLLQGLSQERRIESYKLYRKKSEQQGREPDDPEIYIDKYLMDILRSTTKSGALQGVDFIGHLEKEILKPSASTRRWQDLLREVRLEQVDNFSCMDFFARQNRVLGENGVSPATWQSREAWKTRMELTWDCIPRTLSQQLRKQWESKINPPKSWQDFQDQLMIAADEADRWTTSEKSFSSGRRYDNSMAYNPKAAEPDYGGEQSSSSYAASGAGASRKRKDSQNTGSRYEQARAIKPRHERFEKPFDEPLPVRKTPQPKKCFQCDKQGHDLMTCPLLASLKDSDRQILLKFKFAELKAAKKSKRSLPYINEVCMLTESEPSHNVLPKYVNILVNGKPIQALLDTGQTLP